MIDTNIKLTELIEPGILQEIQNSFAAKNMLGLAIYNEQDIQITTPNLNLIPGKIDYINKEFLNLLFLPRFEDINTNHNFQYDKTIYSSFLNKEIIRAVIPVFFQDQLMLKISLLQRTNSENDILGLLTHINENSVTESSLASILDKTKPEPGNELISLVENFKNQVLLLLEAGWQRTKVQYSHEEFVQIQPPEPVVSPQNGNYIIFTTSANIILDATQKIINILGYKNTSSLIGEDIIHNLILLQEEQNTIKEQLQKSGKLDWYSTILKCKNGSTLYSKIQVVPQKSGKQLIGYEYHFELSKVNQAVDSKAGINSQKIVPDKTTGPDKSKNKKDNKKESDPETDASIASLKEIGDMFDAMPNPILIIDEHKQICIWNRLMEDVFNISPMSVLGTNFTELLLNDSQRLWEKWLAEFKAKKKESTFYPTEVLNFLDRKGDIINARISLAKINSFQREFISVIFKDWHYKSQETKFFQDYIDKIVDSAIVQIITNESGLIIYANKVALSFLEIREEFILNKNIQELFLDDIDEYFKQNKNITKNNYRQFIAQMMPEYAEGKIINLKIKKLDTPNTLDQYLLWELKSLPKGQSYLMHKNSFGKIQKLDYLRGIFPKITANFEIISNELYQNTSSLLLNENINDEAREYILNIKKLAKKASDIKKELQHFCCTGKNDLEPINLNEIINQWQNTLRQAVPKHITLELNLKNNIGCILANGRQIKHVLKILIKNSVDSHSTGGKIYIHTRVHKVKSDESLDMTKQKGKTFIALEVIDSGSGIPMNIRDQLFEPFVTTKDFTIGKGLGLASVYGIIKNHNGYIAIKTLDGQGTIVSLFFPMVENTKNQKSADDTGTSDIILLIDDDPGIIEVNSITLKHFGFSTLPATNANKGIELLKKHKEDISIIILDISLPDMEGIICAEKLLKISSSTPIILSSGYHCDENYYKFMKKTGAVWLQKPYTSNKLYQAIQDLLSKKRS
ncbi:response regulator [candidate division KSB1 bacterium]|nr:response regulator [candidate division KSB1 bacterium]